MAKYSKVMIVSTGLLSLDRAPAASAWLAGMCERYPIEYEVFDFNVHLKNVLGTSLWEKLFVIPVEDDGFPSMDPALLVQVKEAIASGVDLIFQHSPDLIAMTVLSYIQYPYTKLVLEAIRTKTAVTIIAGGTGISYQTSQGSTVGRRLLDENLLDYYVLGEGDDVFKLFLDGELALGINHKDNQWESWVPQINELDGLTFPSYKKINLADYEQTEINNRSMATATITGSRGCVRRCTFCDIGHVWKKFRFRSADDIAKEIVQHYLDTKILRYHFSDSLINGSLKHFVALMERLVELHTEYPELKDLQIDGQFIIREKKHHPEYMYELMRKSGVFRVEAGIESGSERVREHMGKKFSDEDLDYHYEMSSKHDITNSLLLFTGYPTETIEDHQDTLNLLKRYQKYLVDGTISMLVLSEPMILLRNTPLANMQDELGLVLFNNEYGNTLWTADTNPTFTVEEKYRRYLETNRLSLELGYPRSFDVVQRTIDLIKEISYLKQTDQIVKQKFEELIHSMILEEV
jgi:radical SAM superfamily enzyme YgiQ (UPF0313 family)